MITTKIDLLQTLKDTKTKLEQDIFTLTAKKEMLEDTIKFMEDNGLNAVKEPEEEIPESENTEQ